MGFTTGILIFDGVEELDFAGPYEIFGAAAYLRPGDRVVTISRGGQPIRGAKGLRVAPDHALDDAPHLDVVVVPGGRGVRDAMKDGATCEFVTSRAAGAKFVTSVCTGALLLLSTGLARGKRVTTHASCFEEARALTPREVVSGLRFVRDGNVVTAAGVSAGIDMSLWLLGQLHDEEFAREVQRYVEYFPAPPYAFSA
jgi:transcriptional regulator GlxA family with amidase domain